MESGMAHDAPGANVVAVAVRQEDGFDVSWLGSQLAKGMLVLLPPVSATADSRGVTRGATARRPPHPSAGAATHSRVNLRRGIDRITATMSCTIWSLVSYRPKG